MAREVRKVGHHCSRLSYFKCGPQAWELFGNADFQVAPEAYRIRTCVLARASGMRAYTQCKEVLACCLRLVTDLLPHNFKKSMQCRNGDMKKDLQGIN